MRPLHINIVLPFITTRPNGGAKIMYEYANRLQERGHRVMVLHSIQRPYRKIKSPLWWKQLRYRMKGLSRPPWFPLHPAVQSMIVPCITDDYVPDGDVTISTWWEMTYMVSKLSLSKGQKFNLIQDYEVWRGHEDLVHDSYKLPVRHMVIAKYLQQLVEQHSGKKPVHIPNAIDTKKFSLKIDPEKRKPHSVIMLYSEENRKGTEFGMTTLMEVKKRFPDLEVDLFGVYDKPDLPPWMRYTQKPRDLSHLMNRNAVFFTPSIGEGWALPPAEAMACGCAVVCTNIGGHADYAVDGETALLAKPKNTSDMSEKLSLFLNDAALRISVAVKGHEFITNNFSWETSVTRMEEYFMQAQPYR